MSDHAWKDLLIVFGVILAAWGFLQFFEGAYFAAFFYNVPVPPWAMWVGTLPVWWLNAVDTVMVVILIAAVLVSVRHGKKSRSGRRLASSTRASSSWGWFVVGVLLLLAVIGYLGFTLTGLGSLVLKALGLGH